MTESYIRIFSRVKKRGRKKHGDIRELFSTPKHEVESLWSRRDARTSSWTSVKRVICFTGVPTRRDVVSRAKTRCQYSAWTAWISSIDCLTLTDTNLCPSDIRATFETKRICSCAPDCLSWFLDFADEDKTFGFNFFENLISKMECKVRSTNFVFSEVFLIWKLIYIVVLIDFYYILCLITNESFEVSFFF